MPLHILFLYHHHTTKPLSTAKTRQKDGKMTASVSESSEGLSPLTEAEFGNMSESEC